MDGVYELRKRHNTRLWYRRWPASAQNTRRIPFADPFMPAEGGSAEQNEAPWQELLSGSFDDEPAGEAPGHEPDLATTPASSRTAEPALRPIKRLGGRPENGAARNETARQAESPATGDEWRTVPASAPSLLLSATDLLDARNPGPVLRRGARYRVARVQNGVVGLEVMDPAEHDGARLGYCAAVDLICIDARFANQKPGRQFGAPTTTLKATVQRLTGGLGQATSVLGSAASSQASRLF